MELRVGETVSAPTSQPGSSCATPDQNNFEGRYLFSKYTDLVASVANMSKLMYHIQDW